MLSACRLLHWALASIFLLAPVSAAGEGPSLASSIAFGTTCARCHEGECSGRLTFDVEAQAAAGHIRRHAGEIPDAAVEELFALLAKMKTECAYPPVDAPVPDDGRWSSALLERLCVPSRRSCLVPLGRLEPGTYRVHMQLRGAQHVHAEVVTRAFETLFEEPLAIEAGASSVSFEAPARIESFLRLEAQEPLWMDRMRLIREADRQ